MDWDQAIERQREALTRIIAGLFAMLDWVEGNSIVRLPLPLYRSVLRVLYPAESAVRRLIVVMARRLVSKPALRRPVPVNLEAIKRTGAGRVSFQLCDPRRSFSSEPRHSGPKFVPRIHAFVGGQLVTVVGRSPLEPLPAPAATIDATRLCRRLSAIKSALENLPREAKRLARWRARRATLPPEKFRKPLRPGRPPGHRKQSLHEVDEVLKDCHWLAWEAARPVKPHTS
jgi:hypothetical protein